MAEIIYGTVSSILFKLGSQAFQELCSNFEESKRLEVELKNLEATLGTIKANILDAGKAAESSDSVKDAISRLEDVVYDADDLLDEFQYEQLRQKVRTKRRSQVRIHLSSLNPLSSRSKMAHRVKEIRERLDKVAADFGKFGLVKTVNIVGVPVEMGVVNSRRETDSSVKSQIIGRNQNKEDIINLLLESTSNQGSVSVVAITGIGGLGKTALAQLVYNEATIQNHFSPKIWVCVSDQFDIKPLIKNILKSAEVTVDELDLQQQLQKKLKDVLGGKRYLIVLDDVWNENGLKWYNFLEYLLDGAPGSKILVTTRIRRVTSAMGINSPYVLEGLDSDQSWDLFEHVVTFRGQNKIDRKLELIGREVVDRCKGVPLAIITLASLMQRDPNENFWLSIKENHEVWKSIDNEEDGILPVLELSYKHLPSHLRPCFAFCSLFPKDFVIYKDRLIQLWNAQGYIQPSIRNQRSVDLGDQYYNDLLSRSFLQEEKKDWNGFITCKMHDLIHDLAQSVAGSSFYTVKDGNETIPRNVRHLFLGCNPSQNFEIKGIRTILRSNDKYPYRRAVIQIQSFSNLICSRVLDFNCADFKMLPNEIGKLKHLRFLDLSGTLIEVLPDFITNLHNLQTLLLDDCKNLKKLPKDTRKLISLECLSTERYQLNYLPKGLGELTSLQTLSKFIVNTDKKDSATLNELRDLNYLGGHLDILNLDMVRNVELESNEANLREKKHLESLKLEWGDREDSSDEEDSNDGEDSNDEEDELLLDNLEPHPNLKKLEIERYQGTRFSKWLSSITNLVSIKMENCRYCQHLPRLDHLPFLECLSLIDFRALEYVADDGIGKAEDPSSSLSCSTSTTTTSMFFPSLKKLDIRNCENLKGWCRKNENEGATSELPCFPCLGSLEIVCCPNLTSMPLFPSLDSLRLETTSIRPLQQTLMMKTNSTSTASASSASSSGSSSTAPPLSNLKILNLERIRDLETLPEEFLVNLTSLEYLKIDDCNKLESLPPWRTHCLASLKVLELNNCPKLTALPECIPTLTSLKTLRIEGCPLVPSMPGGIYRLTSLEELLFYDCANLRALLEWIPTLTSLESLEIVDCPHEPSLPGGIPSFPSLKKLVFSNCPNLRALPEWIPTLTSLRSLQIEGCRRVPSLPGGMQRLTSLKELIIDQCPKLSETCEEESSIHWPQIAQIPNIFIEYRWVRGKEESGNAYRFETSSSSDFVEWDED